MGDLISESKMTAGGVNTLRGALPALYRHQSSVVYNIIYVSIIFVLVFTNGTEPEVEFS